MNKKNKRRIRRLITTATACACALGLLAPVSVSAAGSVYGVETSIEADAELMKAAEEGSIPAAAEGNAIPGAAAEEEAESGTAAEEDAETDTAAEKDAESDTAGEEDAESGTAAEETATSDGAAEDPESTAALPEEDAFPLRLRSLTPSFRRHFHKRYRMDCRRTV